MRDEGSIHIRLEQLRGQLLQWGTPDLRVFVITNDELRGWIQALEWILGKDLKKRPTPLSSEGVQQRAAAGRPIPCRASPALCTPRTPWAIGEAFRRVRGAGSAWMPAGKR